MAVNGCSMVMDDLDPNTAVTQVVSYASSCVPAVDCTGYQLFVTHDAGNSWQTVRLPAEPSNAYPPYANLASLATARGVTYALFHTPPRSTSQERYTLVISRDGLRTWTAIDQALAPVERFWINPVTGAILALTQEGSFDADIFWLTRDTGQHWTRLADPPFPIELDDPAVQTPFANQPWHICGANPSPTYDTGDPNPHTDDLACTTDGGATWQVRHIAGLPTFDFIALADDGALLLEQGFGSGQSSVNLYRLAPGQTAPDPLGPVPPSIPASYAPGSGAGMLWALPRYPTSPPGNAPDRIITATYA
jgi:hypothetical protein